MYVYRPLVWVSTSAPVNFWARHQPIGFPGRAEPIPRFHREVVALARAKNEETMWKPWRNIYVTGWWLTYPSENNDLMGLKIVIQWDMNGIYHLVICDRLPWKITIFKNGKPSISMGHLYHGEL